MDKLVTIATYDRPVLADFAKSMLEAEGISCYLQDDNLVAMNWLLSSAVGGVKLQVSSDNAELALKILQESRPPKEMVGGEVAFACESCGSILKFPGHRRGGVESCSSCGEYVDVPE